LHTRIGCVAAQPHSLPPPHPAACACLPFLLTNNILFPLRCRRQPPPPFMVGAEQRELFFADCGSITGATGATASSRCGQRRAFNGVIARLAQLLPTRPNRTKRPHERRRHHGRSMVASPRVVRSNASSALYGSLTVSLSHLRTDQPPQ
jgi:hypothetical protein